MANIYHRFDSYAEARHWFDKVKPYRGRDERPIGNRRHNMKTMRMATDGTIIFSHWQKDILKWRPDNRLTVHGYPSVTTTALLNSILPQGVQHLCGGHDPMLILCDPSESFYGEWVRDPETNRYKRLPPEHPVKIIKCQHGVTLKRVGRRWEPASKLEPFIWRVAGKRARAAVAKSRLNEFKAVVPALLALLPDVQPGYGYYRWFDYTEIEQLIADGKFAEAFELCPKYRRHLGWADGINHGYGPLTVPQSVFRKLRDRAIKRMGATATRSERVLTLAQYRTYRSYLNRFG